MPLDFSEFFHQSSKDHTGHGVVRVPADSEEWPIAWKTVQYKTYPHFAKIPLGVERPQHPLADVIEHRASRRDFNSAPIDMNALGTLLKFSCGMVMNDQTGHSHRAQASGGGRYPIEVYPLILSGTRDVPAGLYHYNVKDHALDVLWQRAFLADEILKLFTYPWVAQASCVFILTACFARTQSKYGERGYRYVLLEAGHVAQNIYLVAADRNIKCCALGGTHDEQIEKLIDIDGITESVVYAVALG